MSMKVITICGSFKFVNEMIRFAIQLELKGNIVLMPIFPIEDEIVLNESELITLGEVHKKKIEMADEVFIVDVNGYIGNSTRSEIEFANSIGKQIKYYSNCESL